MRTDSERACGGHQGHGHSHTVDTHPPLLDQFHHLSKRRAVKVCAGVAVVHKEPAIRKAVFLSVLPQNGTLGLDAHAFAADFIVAAQSAI